MGSKLNKDGMTFEEWVCAAGCARFADGNGSVLPYQETVVQQIEYCFFKNFNVDERSRLLNKRGAHWVVHRYGCLQSESVLHVPERKVNYPLSIRKAWMDCVDPTEMRAQ